MRETTCRTNGPELTLLWIMKLVSAFFSFLFSFFTISMVRSRTKKNGSRLWIFVFSSPHATYNLVFRFRQIECDMVFPRIQRKTCIVSGEQRWKRQTRTHTQSMHQAEYEKRRDRRGAHTNARTLALTNRLRTAQAALSKRTHTRNFGR